MTVEVRKIEVGQPRQYVIGHGSPTNDDGHHTEVIKWDGVETAVHPSEVFSGDEAAELFISYYLTGWVPGTYALRLLKL